MADGLFRKNRGLFFQMDCDVYYAQDIQNEYNEVVKQWEFDATRPCSFYPFGDQNNQFAFEDKVFDKMQTAIFGRFKDDIRKASDGVYHPLSHILVTNIRGATCETDMFFIESNGNYVGEPTIFEIKSFQPFIGPFNRPDYYKTQLNRSDRQVLNNAVS